MGELLRKLASHNLINVLKIGNLKINMVEEAIDRKIIHLIDRGDSGNLERIGRHMVSDDRVSFIHYQHTCGTLERWVDRITARPQLNYCRVLVLFSKFWFPILSQVVQQNYERLLACKPEGTASCEHCAPSPNSIGICMCGLDTWHLVAQPKVLEVWTP